MKNLRFPAPESFTLEIAWAARHDFGAKWVHFAPRVAAASLWHIEAGELRAEADGATQIAREGDWVWRPPCGARRLETGIGGATWHTVGMVALCGGKNWFAPPQALIFRPDEAQNGRGARLMSLLVEGQARASRLESDGLGRALMGWLWRAAGEAAWQPDLPPWLETALVRIESQPSVSVGELAQGAHFSPAQFRRLWEKHLGSSPRDTLARRRLEIARQALESEESALSEVAHRAGFGSAAHFSREFKRHFDLTPHEWRRAAREGV